MKLKLFPKIALISVLLATLPVLIVGWQTYTLNREHLENNILELQTNLANSLAKRIDYYLDAVTGKLRAFIETMRMQGISSPAPFQAFLDSNNEFVSMAFLNSSGREILKAVNDIYSEDKKFISHGEDPVYKDFSAQKGGDQIEPKFKFFFEKKEPRLKIIYAYDPSNISNGSLAIVISLKELWDNVIEEGSGVGGGGRTNFIADQAGNLIAHSDPGILQKILDSGPMPAVDNPLVAEALQARTVGSKEFTNAQGEDMVGSYSLIRWTGWVSGIQQSKKEAYFAIYQTRKRALLVVALSILVGGVAAFFLAKGLSKPIFQIIFAAHRVAENNFDTRVEIRSDDELGDLATTFNDMVWALRSYRDLQVDRIIEEKTKTESVIFSIDDGIIMTDALGKIQILNQRAARALALDRKSENPSNPWVWVGKNILDVVTDPQAKEILSRVLVEHGAQAFKEITVTDNQETRFYQLTSESVVNPRTDKNLGVVTVVHDVTLERQLDQLKESFLHSITHDLRNPMTSIQGFTKFLLDQKSGVINDAQRTMLETMDRAGVRFLAMIDDILDIAKYEAGKLEIDIKTFILDSNLETLKSIYQPMADKRKIDFQVQWEVKERPVQLAADENIIERVIGNLVANALKFTPMEGKVLVRVQESSDKLQISVTDSGPGIPENFRQKIFDKFQQLGPGRQKGGTGLGLTISKHFIELHKGEIWVEAGEGGKGSCFVFRIPKNLMT